MQDGEARSVKLLTGILRGLWVVTFGFVKEALRRNCLPAELEFEVGNSLGVEGPKRGRENKLAMVRFCFLIIRGKLRDKVVRCFRHMGELLRCCSIQICVGPP